MRPEYVKMVKAFMELSIEDKREEILKNIKELMSIYYRYNNMVDNTNTALPVLNDYSDEDKFCDALFTYLISLKEETAKLFNGRNN